MGHKTLNFFFPVIKKKSNTNRCWLIGLPNGNRFSPWALVGCLLSLLLLQGQGILSKFPWRSRMPQGREERPFHHCVCVCLSQTSDERGSRRPWWIVGTGCECFPMNGVAIIPLADDCICMKHWDIIVSTSVWIVPPCRGIGRVAASACLVESSSQHCQGCDACK